MALTTANPSDAPSMPLTPPPPTSTAASPLNRQLWQNPFFQRDAAHTRHSATPGAFARRTLRLLIFAALFTIFVYVIYIAPDWIRDSAIYISGTAVAVAFFVSVVTLPLLDAAAARAGMHAVNADLVLGVDDFPAMSDTARRQYVRGRHGLAQVMVWRLAMLFSGLRVVVVIMALMQLAEFSQGADGMFLLLMVRFAHEPSSFVLLALTLIPVLACYLLEPLWRLRLMTAWGMRVASSGQFLPFVVVRLALIVLVYWGVTAAFYLLGHHHFMATIEPTLYGFVPGWMQPIPNVQNIPVEEYTAMISPFRDAAIFLLGMAAAYSLLNVMYHAFAVRFLRHVCCTELADEANIAHRRVQLAPFAQDINPPYVQPTLRVRTMRAITPPRSLWTHPAFIMDARGIRRGRTRQDLGRFTALQVVRALVGVLVIALIWTVARWETYQQMFSYSSLYSAYPIYFLNIYLGELTQVILLISLGLNLYMDAASVLSGLNTINADMVAGRWDIMRITALPESELISVKHGITQLRTWRSLVTILTLRITVLVLLFVLVLWGLFDGSYRYNWIRSLVWDVMRSPATFVLVLFLLTLAVSIFLIEPVIRLRTTSMIGVANSVGRDTIRALMTGFASVVGLSVSQAALTAIMFLAFQWFHNFVMELIVGPNPTYDSYMRLYDNQVWAIFQIILVIVMPPLFLFIHYLNYRFIRWASRRRVMRMAFTV